MRKLLVLAALCGCTSEATMEPPPAVRADAGTVASVAPDLYPSGVPQLDEAACAADQANAWSYAVPLECEAGRACIDSRGRTWAEGEPWIVHGVYHGGREVQSLLTNCPPGAACEATQPGNDAEYVQILADARINLILENRDSLSEGLSNAIAAEPRMKIAQLLFGDPFSMDGRARLVEQIERAAADPSVAIWFGPDEPDLNRTWPMATGIARLLRGNSPDIDALLAGKYAPPSQMPFLPATEPAHDPHGLPYASAVVIDDTGLAVADEVYDFIAPVTYPFVEAYARADGGIWTIARISQFASDNAPMLPVLQMGGIEGLNLVRPSAGQMRAQIMGALVHGAIGSHYFKIAGDDPLFAGRNGWFAADDVESWAELSRMHALWERLVPALYSQAEVEQGVQDVLHWRRFTNGDRRVVLIVNPTPYERWVDLDEIVRRADGEVVRHWSDCGAFTRRASVIEPYEALALEVIPGPAAVPSEGDPTDPTIADKPTVEPARTLANTWEEGADLFDGRSSFMAVTDTEGLALIGGYAGSLSASDDFVRYPDGIAWLPLSTPVASAGAAVIGSTIVIAGGAPQFAVDSPVLPLDECQRFTGSAWISCAPLGNGPTASAPYVQYFDDLFLFGGLVRIDRQNGNLATAAVQRYDPEEDRWSAETHMPEIRVGAAAMLHGGVAYIAGGFGQTSVTSPVALTGKVLAYDLHTRRWLPSPVSDLPTLRANLSCTVVGGYGYCVGGFDTNGDNVATVERLDFSSGRWETQAELPLALSDTVAVQYEDTLYVIGGVDSTFSDSRKVFVMR